MAQTVVWSGSATLMIYVLVGGKIILKTNSVVQNSEAPDIPGPVLEFDGQMGGPSVGAGGFAGTLVCYIPPRELVGQINSFLVTTAVFYANVTFKDNNTNATLAYFNGGSLSPCAGTAIGKGMWSLANGTSKT